MAQLRIPVAQDAERLRADAQQNRARIVEAARVALAAAPDASLNSIAKAARVGPGTLYRHFPNRDALVLEVYRQEIQQLVDLAPALLAAHPPLIALRAWLDRLAHYGRIKHGLADVLHAAMTDSVYMETYRPMVGAIDQLLRACEAAEAVRSGIDAEDLLLLMGFLWRVEPGREGEARAGRLLNLVIDALQARPVAPITGRT
ncbi:MAG TPA: TetR/AcrR family transcriptional regulator [Caulobacteraceae bacterium]|nr:TetR/AcrR family transcriptional regulator [Caulobacteraceae bacterium]